MERTASSFCRIDLPLWEALPLLHDEETRQIELFCEAPHLDLSADWRSTVATLRSYARDHGLRYTLHAPCFDLNPAAANAGVRAEVLRQYRLGLEVAAELGANQMVVHSGPRSDPRLSSVTAHGYVRAMLEALLPTAEQTGTRLALENTGYGPASIIATPADLLALVEGLPPALVGLTLDMGHAVLQNLPLNTTIAAWAGRLCNVHLHDNGGHSDDHLPPGEGVVPLATALETLNQVGFSGSLTLESFLGGPQPLSLAAAWNRITSKNN
ncbi:MAG: sugar phosphate isomerase/epimerase [Chloroflexaceae bacterium]|jgi:sugar phosphate isomerase/epimerase|nr:sugar phosphate isomerase/epimerase [Chloroflexaceae bacterium]